MHAYLTPLVSTYLSFYLELFDLITAQKLLASHVN